MKLFFTNRLCASNITTTLTSEGVSALLLANLDRIAVVLGPNSASRCYATKKSIKNQLSTVFQFQSLRPCDSGSDLLSGKAKSEKFISSKQYLCFSTQIISLLDKSPKIESMSSISSMN